MQVVSGLRPDKLLGSGLRPDKLFVIKWRGRVGFLLVLRCQGSLTHQSSPEHIKKSAQVTLDKARGMAMPKQAAAKESSAASGSDMAMVEVVKKESPQETVYLTLSEVQAQCVEGLTPESGVPCAPSVLRVFMAELEAFIYWCQSSPCGSCPDTGGHAVKMAENNVHDKKVQIGVDTNDVLKVSFCYVGTVTNVPVNGAIKVCSAFNADFYITPKAGSNVPTSINFTPAWTVPEDKHPNLKFKESTITFTYSHKPLLGSVKEIKMPVKLCSLVTDDTIYDQPGSEFVVLKRPATDIILKGVGVKRQVVQKTLDMEWRQYKFLMV